MAENGTVEFVLGKIAKIVVNGFGVNLESFVEGFALGELGKGGG